MSGTIPNVPAPVTHPWKARLVGEQGAELSDGIQIRNNRGSSCSGSLPGQRIDHEAIRWARIAGTVVGLAIRRNGGGWIALSY